MKVRNTVLPLALLLLLITACKKDASTEAPAPAPQTVSTTEARFRLLSPAESGINFSNEIAEDYTYNILNFEYLYNGGGVAVGDINNDNLPDLYFSGTFVANRLYLNKGNLQFEDITDKAGVAAANGFKTGVTMADINNDGWLDIFVCRTSKSDDGQKDNLVYLNNGDLTFTESARQLGLNDNSNSNHANFFDYDLDGDLDLYLLNHRLGFKDAVRLRLVQDESGAITRQTKPMTVFESDRLYRNDGSRFTDVSQQAGINNSAFGLSATVSDLNLDGYPDIYVANDYIEPDYVYLNNGNGTFTDHYNDYIRHSSQNSMGSDIADFNNDGLPDIIVLDMIADDPVRYKQLMNIMQLERYETLVKYGYGHQVARNVLQMNNGNGTFSEVGQLAGVSNTDWSWGAFFADFDNDGYKDIYIGNGYKRDVTDMDYMVYIRDSIEKTGGITKRRFPDINTFLDLIPSTKLQNYMFHNQGDMTFEAVSGQWGLSEKTFSNGTAYGDLDNDGDLDLVVNNIGDPAFVYENKSRQLADKSNYLQLKFKGGAKNPFGLGVKASLKMADGSIQYQELTANRGFFSASQPFMHFGLGKNTSVQAVHIQWSDGKTEVLTNIDANQQLTVEYAKAKKAPLPKEAAAAPIFEEVALGASYQHQENEFQDFNQERLLPHQISQLGPKIAVGDVNGDQREDFFIGGATGSPGAIFIQNQQGKFQQLPTPALTADQTSEDIDAVFFDADGDQDLDLYVVSGGKTQARGSAFYRDRLYLNDGKGGFSRDTNLPVVDESGSCVSAHDYDGDGDLDLFVGGRVVPKAYPSIPKSYILQNNGGKFQDVTASVAPDFQKIGMVTDIRWANLDGKAGDEMIVMGEWMPITVFSNSGKELKPMNSGLTNSEGWWNCVALADFDQDGDIDLVGGNLGQNTRLKASSENPLAIFAKDFDSNGAIDAIFSFSDQGKYYPFAGRDMLVKQVSKVKKNYPRYAKYATATVEEIFTKEALRDAQQLYVRNLNTTYFENQGDGTFRERSLPSEAQLAPVGQILSEDFNGDGHLDLLMVGNHYGAEPETGVYDAANGTLLLGDGKGNFRFSPNRENGFWASGEARDVEQLQLASGKTLLVVANNDGPLQTFVKK